MSKRTCELKENACIFYKGAHYTNNNITDSTAVQMLKAFPGLKKQFVKLPASPAKKEQPKAEKKEAPKKAPVKKAEPKKEQE